MGFRLFALLLGVALVAAACGGGGEPAVLGPQQTPAGQAGPPAQEEGAREEGERPPAALTEATPVAPEEFDAILDPLQEKEKAQSYSVRYRATVGGERWEMILKRLRPQDWERLEGESAFGGYVIYVRKGDVLYVCDRAQERCEEKEKAAGLGALTMPGMTVVTSVSMALAAITAERITGESGFDTAVLSRRVAGEEAQCFLMRDKKGGSESEVCYTEDGVPVLWRFDQNVVEAVEVSREVSEADFEPPYPVQ